MRPLSRIAALLVLPLNACYPAGDGKPPPLNELYFPTGVVLDGLAKSDDGGPKYLYVVNSDFDLQYRAASVISYDLDLLRNLVPRNCNEDADCSNGDVCDAPNAAGVPPGPPHAPSYYCVDPNDPKPCREFEDRDEADLVLNPGRCKSIDPITPQDHSQTLVVDTVGIGAFATDAIWRANPDSNATFPSRLFVPVRGDSTLHWIDVKDGRFTCGQNNGDDDGCDSLHRAGDSTSDNLEQLKQPSEPYALDATTDGSFVAITNQTTGSVSLYANDWRPNFGPMLVSILGNLPFAPVGIAALPAPDLGAVAKPAAPGFLVAYRSAAQIDLLRVRDDAQDNGQAAASYNRYALRRAGSVPINANSLGFDSRGIVIDDWQRRQDYAACHAQSDNCLSDPSLFAGRPSAWGVRSESRPGLLVGGGDDGGPRLSFGHERAAVVH
jgi:hypothetical protein